MEGTIKIEGVAGLGISVEMNCKNVSRLDMLSVFDGLAKGFRFDEKDRQLMGLMFAAGGVEATGKAKAVTVELDKDLLKALEKLKENKNETDSN